MSLNSSTFNTDFSEYFGDQEQGTYFTGLLSSRIITLFGKDTLDDPFRLLLIINNPDFKVIIAECFNQTLEHFEKTGISRKIHGVKTSAENALSCVVVRTKNTKGVIENAKYNPVSPFMTGAFLLGVMNLHDSVLTNFLGGEPRFGPALNTLISIPGKVLKQDSDFSIASIGTESLQVLSHAGVVAAAIGIFVMRLKAQGIKVAMKDWTFLVSILGLGFATMNSADTTLMKWFDSEPLFGKIIDDFISTNIHDFGLQAHQTNTVYELTPAVIIAFSLFFVNNVGRKWTDEHTNITKDILSMTSSRIMDILNLFPLPR